MPVTTSDPCAPRRRAPLRHPRRAVLAAVTTVGALLLVSCGPSADATADAPVRPAATSPASSASSAPAAATATPPATAAPWVGLLSPTDTQTQSLEGSGVTRVMVAAGWDAAEPLPGVFNPWALDELRQRVMSLEARGFDVVIDPGLQYPPSWAFSLPGTTRFVNQYGEQWHGGSGTDVVNPVFNPAVRSAQGVYLARLGVALQGTGVASVRVGGLLSGELRYPPQTYNGRSGLLWDYDPAAQAAAPVRGWKPGSGSDDDARSSLAYYFSALTGYETWLMRTTSAAFPRVDQQVLLPSWGLRPGMVDAAVAAGLDGSTVAEKGSMIAEGLDWENQVKAIAATGLPATVYSTWVDAPKQGSTVQQISPVEYLAQLAARYGLPLAGENTGGSGPAALSLTVARMRACHLVGVMYMSGALIDSGQAGVTLSQFRTAADAATTR